MIIRIDTPDQARAVTKMATTVKPAMTRRFRPALMLSLGGLGGTGMALLTQESYLEKVTKAN